MTQRTAICAGLVMLSLAGASAAQAQPYFYGPREYGPRVYDNALPSYEIMRVVRSTGLVPMSRPMRRGPTYVVVATDRSGGEMRVVVDAVTGDVMNVRPMIAMRPAPFYPNEGPPFEGSPAYYGPGARFDGGVPPVPPRDVPRPRIVTAPAGAQPPAISPPHAALPARVATAPTVVPPAPPTAPVHTPMPRPRPSVAANEAPAAAPPASPAAPVPAPTATAPAIIKPAPAAKPEETQMVPVAPLD